MKRMLTKALLCLAAGVALVSCDKDFNEIGSDFVGDDHFGLTAKSYPVVAYGQKVNAVQSNNLPINSLGIYNHPVFGKTTASFVTQIELLNQNPTWGENPQVTKVELTVPYFATRTDFDSDTGNSTYALDSIFGSGKINLKVFESNYFLRDLDPSTGFQQFQRYYTDQGPDFDANHGIQLNDEASPAQNDEFFFDPAEVLVYETNDEGEQVVTERLAPRMRLNLNKSFFQEKIFGASAAGQLVNNNQFKQYFKGLYFKVIPAASNPDGGALAMMNFKQGKISVTYEVGPADAREEKTYVINLTGNTVNLLENADNTQYASAVANADPVNGDSKIYLKGGMGAVAVVKIFQGDGDGDGIDDLEFLKNENILVNDASLTFTVDRTVMPDGQPNPLRVFLYDINNKRPLIDYSADVTTVSGNPQKNKYIHDGIYDKVTDRYRIRLTNHVRNLVNRDSTNVTLGLAITSDINNAGMARLRQDNAVLNSVVPVTSVIDPRGTVLYGSNLPVADPKRVQLKIYYSKPN